MNFLHKMLPAAALVFAGMAAAPAHAVTTVLDFGPSSCAGGCSNNSNFDQSYGDQAGLDISYRWLTGQGNSSVSSNALNYWDQYGSLQGVAWGGTSSGFGVPEITFLLTQPGTSTLTLNGLDYAGYASINRPTSFRVYDLDYNLLFNSGNVVAPGIGSQSIAFGTSSVSGLRLQWGPDGYDAGIDNLSFSLSNVVSPAPEPTTWLMMIFGFGMVGSVLRRRKPNGVRRFA